MRLIKGWNQFNLIQELDSTGTYLDPKNFKKSGTTQNTSITRMKYGKIFAQAPKTADKSWGLKFVENGFKYSGILYKVIFPDDFMKYFNIKSNRPDLTKDPINLSPAKISDFENFKKPLPDSNAKIAPNQSGSLQPGEKINWQDLQDINIVAVKDSSNRTHFLPGVPDQFKGIGLGYIVYEEFIKFLGYASSDSTAKLEAQKVWSQIIQDPDFYGMVVKRNANDLGAVFVVHKDCNKPNVENEIIEWVKRSFNRDDFSGIAIDDNIFKKYPNLQKYKEKWTFETRNKLSNIYKSLEEIFKNEDLKHLDEVIEFASDNLFEIVDWDYTGNASKEKQALKDALLDLAANPAKLKFYQVVFEKLLSSQVLGFEIFRKILKDTADTLKESVRNSLIKYLWDKVDMKQEFKKILDYVSDKKLNKEIATYKINETDDPRFRFKYFYENQDTDLEDFIKWCNNYTFNPHQLDVILQFFYLVKDKQKLVDKLNKNVLNQFLAVLEKYAFRQDQLLLVDNLEEMSNLEENIIQKKDFSIENSYEFYKFLFKYLEGEELKKTVEKFLNKYGK